MNGYTSLTLRLTQEQGATSYLWTSIGHCLETRNHSLPQFSSMDMVTPPKNQGSCTAVLLTGCQAPQKAGLQVTDKTGYLILGHEIAQQIGYIHFTRITPPKLIQLPKTHAHLKAKTARIPKYKETSKTDQDLRHPNIQLLDDIVFICGKKHNLPITKKYILKEYSDVFC